MAEGHVKRHTKEYIAVFIVLAVLTVVELYVPELKNISKFMKGSVLTALAVAKAFTVAYFYMHLKEETGWLKFIAAIPLSAGAYALVVILESIYR